MSQAEDLLNAGQKMLAEQFATEIKFFDHVLKCSRSAFREKKIYDPDGGGFIFTRQIDFWLAESELKKFAAATPKSGDKIDWNTSQLYIDDVTEMPGETLLLTCIEAP